MEKIQAFIEASQKAETEKSLHNLFSKTVRGIGYHGFDAFSLRSGTINNVDQPGNFFICDYDFGLLETFVLKGWLQTDPTMTRLSKTSQPFEYIEFLRSSPASTSTKWQLAITKLYNIHQAWMIPLNTAGATRGVSCYMRGKGPEVTSRFYDTKHLVQLLASELMGRLDALKNEVHADTYSQKQQVKLSPRELDCLHWTARGKTNAEIGGILQVSENTVRFHLKNAFSKLGVNSRSSAVIAAARMGLIEI